MTITYQDILATRQTATSSTASRTHVVTNNPQAGDLIVFVGARNDYASDSGSADTLSYSESGKWTELYKYAVHQNGADATVGNGCILVVFVGRANSNFSGGTFTWSYGTSVARAVWGGIFLRSDNGGRLDVIKTQTGSGNATTTSVTLTNDTGRSDLAYVYCSAIEHSSAAPGTPFSAGWTGTAGTALSNGDMSGTCYRSIPGTTADQTGSQVCDNNLTQAQDWAAMIVAVAEYYGQPPSSRNSRPRGSFINSRYY